MSFGVFAELSPEIQGLAHLAELSYEAIKDPEKILVVGEVKSFKMISIEPADHCLGLSPKALEEKPLKANPVSEGEKADDTAVAPAEEVN